MSDPLSKERVALVRASSVDTVEYYSGREFDHSRNRMEAETVLALLAERDALRGAGDRLVAALRVGAVESEIEQSDDVWAAVAAWREASKR